LTYHAAIIKLITINPRELYFPHERLYCVIKTGDTYEKKSTYRFIIACPFPQQLRDLTDHKE
jgi:hypothetical protein